MGEGLSVGIDLVEVERFSRAIERWPRLLDRVFTAQELADCAGANRCERLAARFAAKEATFKALSRGWPDVAYRDIEVRKAKCGAPWLRLEGAAERLADGRAAVVSLSHTGPMATAHVVVVREQPVAVGRKVKT